ncbi:MAG: translation initiation factor IF-2 subunit alpha [Candidatus Thermoplasmatota archaeon]|jgi:translation initiation factor 2 subunit 1|nr:translation initiation factor IF-2 subunit alpha [Candidatus Thermoplasmatota archaeon]
MNMETEIPEEGDLVVVTILKVDKFSADVRLDEYPGVNGYIHISEVASGWVKFIRDHLREGQKTVCKVLQVDPKRRVVELSLKRVNEHQKRDKISQWKNDQKADKLMEIVAQNLKKKTEQCMEEFGNDLIQKYGSLYEAFEEASSEGDEFMKGTRAKWRTAFIKVAEQNVASPFVKIGGKMEMYSLASDGIDKVKACLAAGQREGVQIQYAGAPRYLIKVKSREFKEAEDILKNSIQNMQESSKKLGVSFEFERESKEK